MRSSKISRRRFTQGAVVLPVSAITMQDAVAQSTILVGMLAAVVDLIVPRDETPSGSDLGVHLLIIENAKNIQNYPQLLSEGMGWLETRARQDYGPPYLDLDEDDRARILEAAFKARPNTLPFVFARRIRDDALTHYYRDPRAWAGLGFYGPIQPMGYPDFEVPPT